MDHYRRGEFAAAQNLCRTLLAREQNHVRSLVLLADMAQQGGRNKLAIKLLRQALALEPEDPAAHDTIALAYEALGRRDEAIWHFTQAIALGLSDAETLVKQSAVLAAPLGRLAEAWPKQLPLAELLGVHGAGPLGGQALLLALLQSTVIHDIALERLFTAIRRGLLAHASTGGPDFLDGGSLEFYCALAQQCFLNEYAFALGEGERRQVRLVHDRIVEALKPGTRIAPLDLIVTGSYMPLNSIPMAESLLPLPWPDAIARLLTQHIREPIEEAADRRDIPALTPIDDAVSLQVQNQYEENPYPRWTTVPLIKPTTIVDFLSDRLGVAPPSFPGAADCVDVLIAGCGTGSHSIDTARRFPQTRVLAIDVSRASLAFAHGKTRDLGLTNVEYAQADILKLGSLDRRFDMIEAVGVLHHLSEPAAGWRLLLSLLRPNGLMLVGLYSASARECLAAARALIAERGYRPTPDDIRACRQDLIVRGQMPPFRDFSSISGCRDLLFNVMEHQFTIPQIKAFLDANRLTFLGFAQLSPDVRERFRRQFPDDDAMRDLASWDAFEKMHPLTFGNMYIFWVQKPGAG